MPLPLPIYGEEIVLRGQFVVLSRRRTSWRTDSTFELAADFIVNLY